MSERFPDATPRPWVASSDGCWIDACDPADDLVSDTAVVQGFGDDRWRADAALIVYAVNLLEPLEAVAEAAEAFADSAERNPIPLVAEQPFQWDELTRALAALDTARKEQAAAE